jgi:hypothetical protein
MKIVRFIGGLGNQMFQYAFYKALQKKGYPVKADLTAFKDYRRHNGFELEAIFPIKLKRASPFLVRLFDDSFREWKYRKLRKIFNLMHAYKEEQNWFSYDEAYLEDTKSNLYSGYWQNENYFSEVSNELKADFQFKHPLTGQNFVALNQIHESDSVGIHVRRGDYLVDPLLGGLCDQDYYQKAIDLLMLKVNSPRYFIFSDDIEWCKRALQIPDPTFISGNKGNQSYIDMQLMSNCKHHIIANSSFSWWAAWLGSHANQVVIAPKIWTKDSSHHHGDMIPKKWIKL